MRSIVFRRFLLMLMLLSLGKSVVAQMPTRSEVEEFLASGRKVMAVGAIPDDFRRTAKEWYSLSRQQGWGYHHPRLLRKNDDPMAESYRLVYLTSGGEVSYGDLLSRWVQSAVDELVLGGGMGLPKVRCYYLRSYSEAPIYAFSQGVLVASNILFDECDESQAIAYIRSVLDTLGYDTRADITLESDCYPLLRLLSRKSHEDWSLADVVNSENQNPATIVVNDTTPLVVLNPQYSVCRNNNTLKMKKTVARQFALDRDIQVAAQSAGCQLSNYTSAELLRHDDERFYNDYCLLSHWGKFYTPQQWLQDSVSTIMERLGAHQYMKTVVNNQEGVPPTMMWAAATIGVVYSPALVALGTHLFSHSERFDYFSSISDYREYAPLELNEHYTLHDEHGYLRSSQYETFCQRMGTSSKNAGYLGSHFALAVGPSVGIPGLASTLGSGITHGYARKAIEIKPSVSMEYAVGSNWSVAADIDVNEAQFFVRSDDATQPFHETWNDGFVNTLGLSARYYRHDCEAPLGGYLGGGLAVSNVIFPPEQGYDLNQELVRNKLKNFYSLRLVWGRNYMFSRHFFFNYALTFDFPFISALKPFITDNPQSPIYREDVNFTSTIASDVWYQNTFVISVKLGWLP